MEVHEHTSIDCHIPNNNNNNHTSILSLGLPTQVYTPSSLPSTTCRTDTQRSNLIETRRRMRPSGHIREALTASSHIHTSLYPFNWTILTNHPSSFQPHLPTYYPAAYDDTARPDQTRTHTHTYKTMPPPAEITIPTTSQQTSSDSSQKPYTLYNITLRLPLRTFVVQKRYSDFAALHSTLTSLADGVAPPAPLPGKSWFKSTVSSPELTEQRRRGLEAYLRAVAESPDRRWRDTPAWRAFLNLPGSSAGSVRSGAGTGPLSSRTTDGAGGAGVGAAAGDPGTWLDLHAEMKRDLQEARRCLARRDGSGSASSTAAIEAGSAAKKALVKAGGLANVLNEGLRIMAEGRRLGEGEVRRRKDLLASARVEREDLERLSSTISSSSSGGGGMGSKQNNNHGGRASPYNGNTTPTPSSYTLTDKASLLGSGGSTSTSSSRRPPAFGGGGGGGRILGGPPIPETARTRELDNGGMLQLQQQQMREQDQDVEVLGTILRRQREMAESISREVEEQTEMLDAVDAQADALEGKVGVARRRVKKIS
ncbi:hypothetical protein F4778DRAFT_759137 [Xylariomycetidae sp. FL2044]|nr:hypothetical protein F4778DRAFT_759137 [Xylariomycetidae sp. FL2044]